MENLRELDLPCGWQGKLTEKDPEMHFLDCFQRYYAFPSSDATAEN